MAPNQPPPTLQDIENPSKPQQILTDSNRNTQDSSGGEKLVSCTFKSSSRLSKEILQEHDQDLDDIFGDEASTKAKKQRKKKASWQ